MTPGIKASTHSYIQTGQEDSKFGFRARRRAARGRALRRARGLELRGLHAHIGSQVFDLEAFEAVAEVLGGHGRLAAAEPRRRPRHRLHRARTSRRAIEDYVGGAAAPRAAGA